MTKSDTDIKTITAIKLKAIDSYFSNTSTYSTFFLIPAFGIELTAKVFELFENSYINHHGFEHRFERPLFILFKIGENEFKIFEDVNVYLSENQNFVYVYCVGRTNNYYLFMYVFECPAEFKDDYDRFLKGKYSEFSIAYKAQFGKNVQAPDGSYMESPIYGAMFKTDTMRKKMEAIVGQSIDPSGEFWAAPKNEYEIFQFPDTKKISYHESSKI